MKDRLPDFAIAALYKNVLVAINDKIMPPTENETKLTKQVKNTLYQTGNNKKNITILIRNKDTAGAGQHIQLLNGILAACHLSTEDAVIINFQECRLSYPQLKKEFKPRQLFLFGVTASELDLPFTIPHFQIQEYDNCSILLLPDIENFMGNSPEIKAGKRKLWERLKIIFNL